MTTGQTAIMLVVTGGLAVTGWICIYKTDVLVRMHRRQYEKYSIVRLNPFAGMVTRSWYPGYLRASGVLIWLWDIALIYLIWFRKPTP